PGLAFLFLALTMLLHRKLAERTVARLAATTLLGTLLSSFVCIGLLLQSGREHLLIHMGNWFHVGEYAFEIALLLDPLSMALVVLTTTVCGLIGMFSFTYMHREPGFARFFLLLLLFTAGMLLLVMAGDAELLFVGWEL